MAAPRRGALRRRRSGATCTGQPDRGRAASGHRCGDAVRLRQTVGMMSEEPVFARDAATAAYYDQRAEEYDEWYTGQGRFAERDRPGWGAEVEAVVTLVQALPAVRTLDVACGSGFLTRHLTGFVVGLDQSLAMVALPSPACRVDALSQVTRWTCPSPTAHSTGC
ncbi:hypothetical protein [Blastococcus brunescens]|uniref:Methyltransferase domain-containing protein n=1 Tax=Blastococcus brunescens TaxID=1564165 RepID=A0ABZ1B548_9ACTN|nr:hypothetical protein [Blastococcus sp. BMG 8361]WRL65938.1 hypothetical protein U6N30_10505 [Blastococcus sp. BMG 8361]